MHLLVPQYSKCNIYHILSLTRPAYPRRGRRHDYDDSDDANESVCGKDVVMTTMIATMLMNLSVVRTSS